MFSRLGVNLDYTNPGGRPEPARLAGFGWARLIARDTAAMERYLGELRRAGIKTLVVLDQDAVGLDSTKWSGRIGQLVDVLHPDAWQIGNEPDGTGPSSSRLSEDDYARLVRRAAPEIKSRQPGATLVGAGLCSGRPEWLARVGAEALGLLDGVAVHPYGQRPTRDWPSAGYCPFGCVADLLDGYRQFGKPLWVSEFGTDSPEAPDDYLAAMHGALAARDDVAAAFVFCWSDAMVRGFGLVDEAGREKPTFRRLRAGLRPAAVLPVGMRDMRSELPTCGPEWPIRQYNSRPLDQVTGVTLHYTGATAEQSAEAIARYQVSPAAVGQTGVGQPFPAIAYTLLVTANGVANLCHDLAARTWHSAAVVDGTSRNASHVGICYTGDREPSPAQLRGLAAAIAWCQAQLGRPLAIEGHRDPGYATGCPGPTWPAWRPALEAELARLGAAGPGPRVREPFRRFLEAHPEWGQPRFDEAPMTGGAYVWTKPTARHPKGGLLVYRAWLDEVRALAWE